MDGASGGDGVEPPAGPRAHDARPAENPRAGRGLGWGLDAAIGAAAIAARSAGGIAGAVGSTGPARAVGSAARRITRPLSKEGEEVRHRLEGEAGPAAGDVLRQVAPVVIDAVDVGQVVASVELDPLLERIDVDRLLDRIDVDGLLERIDVEGLLDRIDVDRLLDRIDVDGLLDRVDVERLLRRIDVDGLVSRVDVDGLLDRVDLNRAVQRVDVDALVRNTEVGSLIARSTSGVASEALDGLRSQGVGLDDVVQRFVDRVLRRPPASSPAGPERLVVRNLAIGAAPSDGGGSDDETSVRAIGRADR